MKSTEFHSNGLAALPETADRRKNKSASTRCANLKNQNLSTLALQGALIRIHLMEGNRKEGRRRKECLLLRNRGIMCQRRKSWRRSIRLRRCCRCSKESLRLKKTELLLRALRDSIACRLGLNLLLNNRNLRFLKLSKSRKRIKLL